MPLCRALMIYIVEEYVDIKVVFALRDQQWLTSLTVPELTTLEDAVQLSQILDHVPEQDKAQLVFGINGRVKPHHTKLNQGDRVEVYRPRLVNPKEQRRQRA